MKTKKRKLTLFVIVLSLLMASVIACGDDGGTRVNPNPEPNPEPPAGISFDSGNITPGSSYSYTFDQTGSVDYICTIHPSMTGSVTIEENASTEDVTVIIDNLSFNPDDITIGPGTKVTWVNQDDVTHTATSQ